MYVRVGLEYTDVETKVAYCFAAIRKKLFKAWEVDNSGPHIYPDKSEGTKGVPLDISDLGVTLSDFKMITMLISDKTYKQIKNLTHEQVQRLDEATKKLKMDTYQWLYNGRTRVGDETGHQIECNLVGKDVETDGITEDFEIDEGLNRKFD